MRSGVFGQKSGINKTRLLRSGRNRLSIAEELLISLEVGKRGVQDFIGRRPKSSAVRGVPEALVDLLRFWWTYTSLVNAAKVLFR